MRTAKSAFRGIYRVLLPAGEGQDEGGFAVSGPHPDPLPQGEGAK